MRTLWRVAGIIFLFDQLTKFLAVSFLTPGVSVPLVQNCFHLTLVENTGIAFGLFQDRPEFWMWTITASVVALIGGAWFFRSQSFSKRIAYAFILGGAVGNWLDRIRLNHVIDFLDFRIWPVFNIADSFITIGVLMFIWISLRGR